MKIQFDITLPEEIKTLHSAFKKHARKLYVVGGAIRDTLLGKIPKDFDLTTEATPEEVVNILNREGIKSFPKGESFGVVSAVINGEEFEIATFREESYENGDGRRPTSVDYSTMEKDVLRRDLTINALYYDIDKKEIIDLVGGVEDLKNKTVKPVGSPMARFEEDRLRVLRAIRFSHRLGSKLDSETIEAIKHFKDLPGVSSERISAEFISGLKSAVKPEDYLEDYKLFGLLPRVFNGASLNTNFIPGLKDSTIVIANILLPNRIDSSIETLKKFKASSEMINNIKFLLLLKERFQDFDKLSFIPNVDGKWLISLKKFLDKITISKEQIQEWSNIHNIDMGLVDKFIRFAPSMTAKDFPEIKPGPELGHVITTTNAQLFLDSL